MITIIIIMLAIIIIIIIINTSLGVRELEAQPGVLGGGEPGSAVSAPHNVTSISVQYITSIH